jgi:hypothetical protein
MLTFVETQRERAVRFDWLFGPVNVSPMLPIAEAVESRASSESRARALIASARCYRGRRGYNVLLINNSIAVT